MPGFIQIMKNPDDSNADDKETKKWRDFFKMFGMKKEANDKNTDYINELHKQQIHIQIQIRENQKEVALLCEKFNRLTQQLAEEGRITNKTEHRRLEVDEE